MVKLIFGKKQKPKVCKRCGRSIVKYKNNWRHLAGGFREQPHCDGPEPKGKRAKRRASKQNERLPVGDR